MEYYLQTLMARHFRLWSCQYLSALRRERRLQHARAVTERRTISQQRLLSQQIFLAWRSVLVGTSCSRRAYRAASNTLLATNQRKHERYLMQSCWMGWTRHRLGSAIERTERLRRAINHADERALQAEARVEEVEQV
jgi:hypothetical protein